MYGNKEKIKVALVTLIDQLVHIENNTEFKKDSLNLALEKSANKKYIYSKENIYQELKSKSDERYDKKKSSDDVKKLKKLYEDSVIRKDDENIKNQKLLDFDEALDFCEIEDILFDIKEMVMVECFKDKRTNKALYINEEVKHGYKKYLRIAFNTD